jgi:hypothetical protein
LPIKDVNTQYKEVNTMTIHIVAFGTFMVAFVGVLAFAL